LNKEHVILVSSKDSQEGGIEFTTEFINSTETTDLPPYYLKLKNKTKIMHMHILYISEGIGIGICDFE